MPSDAGPFNLDLMLTRSCPLSCGYCRMEHTPGAMTKAVWRRAVELLLQESGPLELQFMGGEPLMEFSLLREISAHAAGRAREAGTSLRQVVTTNGILLTPARSLELAEMGCGVMLSLDGGRASQALQRPMRGTGAWTRLRRNLKGLLASGARSFVNLVATPASAPRLAENAGFLFDEGVRSLQIAYALGVRWEPRDLDVLEEGLAAVCSLARSARPRIDIFNRGGASEPVLLSPQHLVDCDGTLFVGTAIVLEKLWPGLQTAFVAGNIMGMKRLPGRRADRTGQLRRIKTAPLDPAARDLLLNNLAVGQRMKRFWKEASR
ncbi:MAG: radical SAM protein [Elusimicrobiota bacterium]|jgi:hypothetical protein